MGDSYNILIATPLFLELGPLFGYFDQLGEKRIPVSTKVVVEPHVEGLYVEIVVVQLVLDTRPVPRPARAPGAAVGTAPPSVAKPLPLPPPASCLGAKLFDLGILPNAGLAPAAFTPQAVMQSDLGFHLAHPFLSILAERPILVRGMSTCGVVALPRGRG